MRLRLPAGWRGAGPVDDRCVLADAKITGTPIDGVDSLLNRMTKAVIERALQAEMTHELGYAPNPGLSVRL